MRLLVYSLCVVCFHCNLFLVHIVIGGCNLQCFCICPLCFGDLLFVLSFLFNKLLLSKINENLSVDRLFLTGI